MKNKMHKQTPSQVKALYIPRGFKHESLKRRMSSFWNRTFSYTGQEGYFEEGLDSAFDTTRLSSEQVLRQKNRVSKDHDVLVVNYKCDLVGGMRRNEFLQELPQQVDLPSVLFIGADQAQYMPPDSVLDQYDLIYKRECFRDKSKYSISEENQRKIRSTMLACPIFIMVQWLPYRLMSRVRGWVQDHQNGYRCDIFFSGQSAVKNTLRLDTWRTVVRELDMYTACGGLQPHPGYPEQTPVELRSSPLSKRAYANTVQNTRVNLALDGIGEFTFRHMEIWHFGGFLMSGPSIRGIEIPLPAKEQVHYVSFDNQDDLKEKAKYYIEHDTEREKIARAGKEMFDRYYDPAVHGQDILRSVKKYL